jgi:hypothetical protein
MTTPRDNTRKCFDCGKTLEWVGRGPGWMNSEQWDAEKAGDYFAPCDKASHPNGNCYFNDYGDGVMTLKPKGAKP